MAKKDELYYRIVVDDKGGFVVENFNQKVKDASEAVEVLSKKLLKNTNAERTSINELKRLRKQLIDNRDTMALTAKEYGEFTQQIDKVNVRIKNFQTNAQGMTKVNGDMQSSAGLAGAAAVEMGRLVSDAGYGLRGVANNIQQLSSILVALAAKAGGAGNAFSLIKEQLRGPLGILILFQGLIALLEYLDREMKIFSSNADKMAEALEDARKKTIQNTEALSNYVDILDDANTSEEARQNAINEIKKSLPDLVDKQGNLKVSTEQLTTAVEKYISQQLIRAEIEALIASNAELFADEAKARSVQAQLDAAKEANDQEKIAEIYEKNATFFQKFLDISSESAKATGGKGLLARLISGDEDVDFVELYRSQTANVIEEAKSAREKIQDLMKGLSPDGAGGTGDEDKEMTLLERVFGIVPAGQIAQRAEISRQEAQKSFLLLIKDAMLRKTAELVLEEEAAVRQLELLGATEAEIGIVRERFAKERNEATEKFYEKELETTTKGAMKELEARIKLEKKGAKRLADFRRKERERELKEREQYLKDIRKSVQEASKALQGVLSDLLRMQRASTENEIAQVDARTNTLLSKENITAEERTNILKRAEEEKERINENAIKSELKLQQMKFAIMAAELSAKIALDIAEAQLSVKKGTANTLAQGLPKALPLLIAYAAQAASIIAGMMAAKRQAQAAIANIGGSAGSSASSTASIQAPDFNVVGTGTGSQLASALEGMLPEPPPVVIMAGDINDSLNEYNSAKINSGIGV